jgi:guanylate kinase
VEFSISATTRAMRPKEVDGVDYHFLDEAEFHRRRAAGDFLESASYNGNYYGTLRQPMLDALEAGKIFILEIEVQGTQQLRDADVDGDFIFIVPPSIEELRRRLINRQTNTPAEIEGRLEIAAREMEAESLYDYSVPNDNLPIAIAAVKERIGL